MPILLAWPTLFFLFKPLDTTADAPDEETSANPAAINSGLTLGEAVRGYRFWVLLLSILFAYQGFSGIGPNLLPSLTDDGFSR